MYAALFSLCHYFPTARGQPSNCDLFIPLMSSRTCASSGFTRGSFEDGSFIDKIQLYVVLVNQTSAFIARNKYKGAREKKQQQQGEKQQARPFNFMNTYCFSVNADISPRNYGSLLKGRKQKGLRVAAVGVPTPGEFYFI